MTFLQPTKVVPCAVLLLLPLLTSPRAYGEEQWRLSLDGVSSTGVVLAANAPGEAAEPTRDGQGVLLQATPAEGAEAGGENDVPAAAPEAKHSRTQRFAQRVTDSVIPFVAAGELSLASQGRVGRKQALRGMGAQLATGAATSLLKRIVREKRPDSEERNSFPSGHASAAFAMASVLDSYQPKYRWLGYGVASTIAWSRVKLKRHYWHDVIAGAALGYVVGQAFSRKQYRESAPAVSFRVKW